MQHCKAAAAPAEDPVSIPSTHIRQITNICDSSSREFETFFCGKAETGPSLELSDQQAIQTGEF